MVLSTISLLTTLPNTYHRTCQGGHSPPFRQSLLGIELAYRESTHPWTYHSPHSLCKPPVFPGLPHEKTDNWRIFGSITCVKVIVILAPPPDVAYPFILDVEGYPQQIVNFLIVIVRHSRMNVPLVTLWLRCIWHWTFKKKNVFRVYFGSAGINPMHIVRSKVRPLL